MTICKPQLVSFAHLQAATADQQDQGYLRFVCSLVVLYEYTLVEGRHRWLRIATCDRPGRGENHRCLVIEQLHPALFCMRAVFGVRVVSHVAWKSDARVAARR